MYIKERFTQSVGCGGAPGHKRTDFHILLGISWWDCTGAAQRWQGHCKREVGRGAEVAAVQPPHLQRTWEEWCRTTPVPYATQSNMSLYNHSLLTLQGRIQDPHDIEKQEFEGKWKGEFLTEIFWLAFLGPKQAFQTQDIHHNCYN